MILRALTTATAASSSLFSQQQRCLRQRSGSTIALSPLTFHKINSKNVLLAGAGAGASSSTFHRHKSAIAFSTLPLRNSVLMPVSTRSSQQQQQTQQQRVISSPIRTTATARLALTNASDEDDIKEMNTSKIDKMMTTPDEFGLVPHEDENVSRNSNNNKRRRKLFLTNESQEGDMIIDDDNSQIISDTAERPATKKTKKKKTTSSKKRGKPRKLSMEPRPPPEHWESIYTLVQELRADKTAPVDSDGGHVLPQKDRGEKIWRFQLLVALMLSSQTKDAVVGETMRHLQKFGLDVDTIQQTSHDVLNQRINKVGFHNNKTKYLKATCEILQSTYKGDIPKSAKELMTLPGIGPKMAFIIESVAFQTSSGIGVDTHMHRIFNALHWVDSSSPEGTRKQLEGWLPKEKWKEINVLWVGLGQEVQQQKEKALRKALTCSRPKDALILYRKLGMDVEKEGKKYGLNHTIELLLLSNSESDVGIVSGENEVDDHEMTNALRINET